MALGCRVGWAPSSTPGVVVRVVGTVELAVQPGFGRVWSRFIALVITGVHGYRVGRRSQRRRPVFTNWGRRRTAAGGASWVPSGGCRRSGRASAARRGGQVRGRRSPARSGSGRWRAGAGCAGRCRGRPGCGPRSGPAIGDAVRSASWPPLVLVAIWPTTHVAISPHFQQSRSNVRTRMEIVAPQPVGTSSGSHGAVPNWSFSSQRSCRNATSWHTGHWTLRLPSSKVTSTPAPAPTSTEQSMHAPVKRLVSPRDPRPTGWSAVLRVTGCWPSGSRASAEQYTCHRSSRRTRKPIPACTYTEQCSAAHTAPNLFEGNRLICPLLLLSRTPSFTTATEPKGIRPTTASRRSHGRAIGSCDYSLHPTAIVWFEVLTLANLSYRSIDDK